MRHPILGGARWALPGVLVAIAVTAVPSSADTEPTLADVRDATVRFHSVEQAEKAGYGDNELPCFDNVDDGGMGEHLINGSLLTDGGELNALAPEALVYEVHEQGGWKLVAIEYVVLFDDAPYPGPAPTVLGQELTPHSTLPLWKLHAWVHRENTLGVFLDYNQDVDPCPDVSS